MTARFLMCPPTFYRVVYQINPWMQPDTWHQHEAQHAYAAQKQWAKLVETMLKVGADISLVTPHPHVPDLVFTANAGVIHGNKAVVARFQHKERQPEEPIYAAHFRQLGFDVLTTKAVQEGAGDMLYHAHSHTLWMGYGQRSHNTAAQEVSQLLDVPVRAVQLVTADFYHIDTCFCPLPSGHVLYYPAAFSEAAQADMHHHIGGRLVAVEKDDAKRFACNAVAIDDHLIMPTCSSSLQHTVKQLGYEPHCVDLDQFLLAGGAAKCLTLRLDHIMQPAGVRK